MNLLLGVGTLAAAAIIFTWALAATRRADTPWWARHQGVTGALALTFTMLFTVGAGLVVAGLFNLGAELKQLGPLGDVALLALAGGGIWVTRRMLRRAAPGAVAAAPPAAGPA